MTDNNVQIRKILLEIINELSNELSDLQSNSILKEAERRLGIWNNVEMEQAVLTAWHDLFRTGYLAWGYNLTNPDPPFCHLTEQGRRTLRHLSRDPSNPDGYLAYISNLADLNSISESYLHEALHTYNTDCVKASAVMIGAASEAIILELRDNLVAKIKQLGETPPKNLEDWRIKRVIEAIKKELDKRKVDMPNDLFERYQANWPAFTQQIRASRNEAGHPTSIIPVTEETVHASLLIFPELVKLSNELSLWIANNYK